MPMRYIKGMATGLLVGATVALLFDPITDRQRRRMHKKTTYAFKRMGNALDSALDTKHSIF